MMLLDQHWYASRIAVQRAMGLSLTGFPHITPEGKATLVCDYLGSGQAALVIQADDGHDLMTTDGRRVSFNPAELSDLERLVEFDHLPEARKATSWLKPGAKLV